RSSLYGSLRTHCLTLPELSGKLCNIRDLSLDLSEDVLPVLGCPPESILYSLQFRLNRSQAPLRKRLDIPEQLISVFFGNELSVDLADAIAQVFHSMSFQTVHSSRNSKTSSSSIG